jgi:hypothetical protein
MVSSVRPDALRVLCFVPDANTPGRSDTSGAFLPEARAFARHHGVNPEHVVRRFPAALPIQKRRAACVAAFDTCDQPLDAVAFFCHGWRDGLQSGFLRANVLVLARLMGMHARLDAHVLLYACDTGRDADLETDDDIESGPGGDGGFADELRDACEALGRRVTVMAHTTRGATTINPYARRFAPGCGGRGGEWYVEPEGPLWRLWVRALRDPRSTLKFRFPMMTPAEIAVELGGGAGGPLVA